MNFLIRFLYLIFLLCPQSSSADSEVANKALWEYGLGLGYFIFEQYPSSNQQAFLFLPFPTFQYRGERIRADDRNGAKAYLWREGQFSLDISGAFAPGQINATNNLVRSGMPSIPWVFSFGPQLVFEFSDSLQWKLGMFPSFSSDLATLKTNGIYFDTRLVKSWEIAAESKNQYSMAGNFAISCQAASQEYLANYFEVTPNYATAARPVYQAQAGFLAYRASLYQSINLGKLTYYLSTSIINYDLSVNKQSPLHKSDHNYFFSIGLNYTIGESEKPAVPEDEIKTFFSRQKKQME